MQRAMLTYLWICWCWEKKKRGWGGGSWCEEKEGECKPPIITESIWGPYFERQKGRECPSWLHPILIQVCKVNSKAIWISLPIWSNLQYTFAFTLLFKDWDFPFFSLTHMYSSRQPSLFTDKTHIRKKRKHTTIPNIMLKTHAEKKKQNC